MAIEFAPSARSTLGIDDWDALPLDSVTVVDLKSLQLTTTNL
jgi:hypothetical protein